MFTVDNVDWDIPCTIERVAEIKASDISGVMLDGTYFNDVLGTFLSYTVSIAIPKGWENEYTQIWDVLTNPDNFHTFHFPYNYDPKGIDIVGRVETVADAWVRLPNGKQTWRKTTFTVISNTPTKTRSIHYIQSSEMNTWGVSPYPDTPDPTVGVMYEYTSNGWVMRNYADADEVQY